MPRQRHYDPQVQVAPAEDDLPPITNYIVVEEPGHYLLTDDVSAWLARFAGRYRGEGRVALLQAAQAFAPTEPEAGVEDEAPVGEELRMVQAGTVLGESPQTEEAVVTKQQSARAAADDGTDTEEAEPSSRGDSPSTVLVPNQEAMLTAPPTVTVEAPGIVPATMQIQVARIEVYPNEDGSYWYARPVDGHGNILGEPMGQVSHHGIMADVERLWPGVPVYEIPDALTDTIWQESNPAASWNGRQRPSPRRLFGR